MPSAWSTRRSTALVNLDAIWRAKVIADDALLDQTQREIDDRPSSSSPSASRWRDLREIIGAIRISGDLERVGDLGKNIAKRVVAVQEGASRCSCSAGCRLWPSWR
jgi:phosphate transport system protein